MLCCQAELALEDKAIVVWQFSPPHIQPRSGTIQSCLTRLATSLLFRLFELFIHGFETPRKLKMVRRLDKVENSNKTTAAQFLALVLSDVDAVSGTSCFSGFRTSRLDRNPSESEAREFRQEEGVFTSEIAVVSKRRVSCGSVKEERRKKKIGDTAQTWSSASADLQCNVA
jgi:hypothetical protein